jgi:hypothetical protein
MWTEYRVRPDFLTTTASPKLDGDGGQPSARDRIARRTMRHLLGNEDLEAVGCGALVARVCSTTRATGE